MNPPSKLRKALGIACLVVATLILMTPTYGVSANGGLFGLSFDRGQNSWEAPDHPDPPEAGESPDYSGPLDGREGSEFPDPSDNPEGSERYDD